MSPILEARLSPTAEFIHLFADLSKSRMWGEELGEASVLAYALVSFALLDRLDERAVPGMVPNLTRRPVDTEHTLHITVFQSM